ncbi:GNAT family N-acetyltransferase [Microlunatus spumicola]|uniref:GNAT family N-acetyltransferase n=1 Tax=Microlunatus spumicola TaxID=81499 RepID=A0ABP6WUT3_9ACTN
MSSTPDPSSLVLRDDLTAPPGADLPVIEGATVLVALPPGGGDEGPVGAALVTGEPPVLRLHHLWVRPDLRRRGYSRAVLAAVRSRVRDRGATVLSAQVRHDDPASTALAAGTRVLGELLRHEIPSTLKDTGAVSVRPLTEDELGPWREAQVQAYAQDNLLRSGGDLERALARSRAEFAEVLPDGLRTRDTSIIVLSARDGAGREERVGHLWVAHHVEPGTSFVYDVEVAPEHRGRGFGRAAMVVADRLARAAGDERVALHVFGGNATARRLYLSHGYAVRSTTHDLLSPADA